MSTKTSNKQMKRIKGSFGSYKGTAGTGSHASIASCDLKEVANSLLEWGNTKSRLTDINAWELALLAKSYLNLTKAKK